MNSAVEYIEKESAKRMIAAKRHTLTALLSCCHENQRKFCDRIYPKGVPDSKLNEVIQLCERTMTLNKKETKQLLESIKSYSNGYY